MDPFHALLLFVAGCLTGFLAGLFGVGGGILLVPVLLLYFHSIGVSSLVATHLTFGTSLLIVIVTSIVSAREYSRNNHVIWRAVLILGLASVISAFAGSYIAASLQGKLLQQIFSLVVAGAAVRLIAEMPSDSRERTPSLSVPGLGVVGLCVGFVSALAGVGGGIISIPLMYYGLGFPLKGAFGTSSATIVITATAAMAGYIVNGWNDILLASYDFPTAGYVDYLHAIPLMVGTIPLARLGASLAHRTNVDRLRKLFALFLLVIAVRLFFL